MRLVVTLAAMAAPAFALPVTTGAARVAPKTPAPPRFTLTKIVGPPGANTNLVGIEAFVMNDKGQAVVTWHGGKTGGSFVWERGKPLRPLGQLANGYSLRPAAINNAGQIVGTAWGENDPTFRKRRAFLWEDGKGRDLGTPEGETSDAFDINNRGEVFLTSYAFGATARPNHVIKQGAFLWTATKGFVPLPVRFEGMAVGGALNDHGQIAGSAVISPDEAKDSFAGLSRDNIPDTDGTPLWRAFLYVSGAFRRLPIAGSWSTHVEALNNRGDLLLNADLIEKRYKITTTRSGGLYLWHDGHATSIVPDSGRNTNWGMIGVSSLNDAGDVTTTIIRRQGSDWQSQAVLYRKGTLYYLDDCIGPNSGWRLTTAGQINNRGQILGTGTHQGKKCAFLLTPQ